MGGESTGVNQAPHARVSARCDPGQMGTSQDHRFPAIQNCPQSREEDLGWESIGKHVGF